MDDYNSILSDKKKKKQIEIPVDNTPKKFPWFKLDVLCIFIILLISYFVYFINVLNPKVIFLNDINKMVNKYSYILEPLNLDLTKDYNVEGAIKIDDASYNYNMLKEKDNLFLSLEKDNNTINYFLLGNDEYIKLSNFKEDYIHSNNKFNIIKKVIKNYNNIPEDKFIKRYYLKGKTPIVESNLTLKDKDLKDIFKLDNLDGSYEVLLNLKNNAISNRIIGIKVTISNLTNKERYVISYQDNYLTYKDKNNNLKFNYERNNKDFTLKVSKDNTLYSVLTGTKKERSYQYMYQVIDEMYNIKLDISNVNNEKTYKVESNLEMDNNRVNSILLLTIKNNNEFIMEKPNLNKTLNKLTKEELTQYNELKDNFFKELDTFIDKHK